MATVCPHCGSDQIRSASPHAHDSAQHKLFSKAFRCRACRHRFWVLNPLKPLLLLVTVGGLVALTAWLAMEDGANTPKLNVAQKLPHAEAAQGDAEAQLQLGIRYAEGDGVIRSNEHAAKWFALAAAQGLPDAEYRYGLALLQGHGVVQDYRAAFNWIEKPALRGYAKAQFSLGELYRYGTGTAINKARAYLWFNLAAAQGLEAAAKARDTLVWQLKPEQIAEMQEEARRISLNAHSPAPVPASSVTPPAQP